MPRNDASRMKLEKYDSSRTCAGIQRISATSRKRTRNDARKTLERTRVSGHHLWRAASTPSFCSASSGHPFHSGTITLPMYCRSSTPILLDQNPPAVRSRKLLKNATPCANSGFAFCGHAMSSSTAVALGRGAVEEPLVEAVLALAIDPGQAAAHRRLRAPGWSTIMKSMNSGTPASVALPDRSSFGMMRSTSTRTVAYSCAVKNFGLKAAGFAPAGAGACRLRRLRGRCRFGVGPGEPGRQRHRAEQSEHRAAIRCFGHGQIVPFLRSSAMKWLVRIASARIVQVQFLSACDTNGPPSATKTFLASCAWQFLFRTEVVRIVAHARDAELVDDPAAGREAVVVLLRRHRRERRAAHLLDDRAEGLLHVLRLLLLVVAPLEVEAQHRDAALVDDARVELEVAVLVRDHLAAAGEADRRAVEPPVVAASASRRSRRTTSACPTPPCPV